MKSVPQAAPAQACATRIQQLAFFRALVAEALLGALPVEAHEDAAVEVRGDLLVLAVRGHHRGGLRAGDDGPRRHPRGANLHVRGDDGEAVPVAVFGASAAGAGAVALGQVALDAQLLEEGPDVLRVANVVGDVGPRAPVVLHLQQHVPPVAVGLLVALQREGSAREEARHVAPSAAGLRVVLGLLEAHPREARPVVGAVHMPALVVLPERKRRGVVVQPARAAAGAAAGRHVEHGAGMGEVEVAQRHTRGLELAVPVKPLDALHRGGAHARVLHRDGGAVEGVDGLVGVILVGEHPHLAALLVAEVVRHALFFEEALHEGEVGLAVLHAVLVRRERVDAGVRLEEVPRVEARGLEHVANHLHDGHVLPDAGVGALRQGPQLGHDHHPREAVGARGAEVFHPAHAAVEEARQARAAHLDVALLIEQG
jgi:hypothetical protein